MLERFEVLENFKNQFGFRGEIFFGNYEIKVRCDNEIDKKM